MIPRVIELDKHYVNYIFDLYGTLVDIRTDERSPLFWRRMAELYARFGADYTPAALRESYLRLCAEETERLRGITHYVNPEIDLTRVFRRLYEEAPRRRPAALAPKEDGLEVWTSVLASAFRALSMKRLRLYPGVKRTLEALRRRGCGVWLLSNAQRVFTVPELETLGLADCFDAVYLSSDFGAAKPEPAFLAALLRERGLDPESCLFVGNDPDTDLAVAAACSVDAVLYDTYGLARPGDRVIYRMEELLWI